MSKYLLLRRVRDHLMLLLLLLLLVLMRLWRGSAVMALITGRRLLLVCISMDLRLVVRLLVVLLVLSGWSCVVILTHSV